MQILKRLTTNRDNHSVFLHGSPEQQALNGEGVREGGWRGEREEGREGGRGEGGKERGEGRGKRDKGRGGREG